jgi:hypothetical protein
VWAPWWVRHAVIVCVRVWVHIAGPPFSPPTPCGTALPLACWCLLRPSLSHGRLRGCGSGRDALSLRGHKHRLSVPPLRARCRCMLVKDLLPGDGRGCPSVRGMSALCAHHAALLAHLRCCATRPEPVSISHHRWAHAWSSGCALTAGGGGGGHDPPPPPYNPSSHTPPHGGACGVDRAQVAGVMCCATQLTGCGDEERGWGGGGGWLASLVRRRRHRC